LNGKCLADQGDGEQLSGDVGEWRAVERNVQNLVENVRGEVVEARASKVPASAFTFAAFAFAAALAFALALALYFAFGYFCRCQ
jgi:hypothetical protein